MSDEKDDDLTITDDDGLLRRVPNWPNMVKYDENINAYRTTSVCFSDPGTKDREVSISLEKDLLDSGNEHTDLITNHPGFGLAKIIASFARNDLTPKQIINRNPTEDDPFHGLIIGDKTKKTKRDLAKNAELLFDPIMPED